jgi:hypothetical protein
LGESGPIIDIELEECYYTVTSLPNSTIYTQLLVYNRGDQSTTLYEVELTDNNLDLMKYISDPIYHVEVSIGAGESVRKRVEYSFPDIKIGGDINFILKLRFTHGEGEINCTALFV